MLLQASWFLRTLHTWVYQHARPGMSQNCQHSPAHCQHSLASMLLPSYPCYSAIHRHFSNDHCKPSFGDQFGMNRLTEGGRVVENLSWGPRTQPKGRKPGFHWPSHPLLAGLQFLCRARLIEFKSASLHQLQFLTSY